MVRRRPPARADQPGQLGAGRRPGHPAVGGSIAGPLQQRLRQQPVPCPAAVLQMAGHRGRDPRPDGQAPRAQGGSAGSPGIHQRRTIGTGEDLPRQHVRRPARRRDHRRVRRNRHPALRTGRDPLRPRATPPAATSTCTPARSASPGRPTSPAPSGSATRRPAASTATCAPAPGTRRPGGPPCPCRAAGRCRPRPRPASASPRWACRRCRHAVR